MNNKLNNLKIKIDGQEYEFQGGGGGSGKVFEDVTSLPETLDENVIYRVGGRTAVPNTGYIEKVYLSTSLNDDEITALGDSITKNTFGIAEMLLSNVDTSKSILIINSEQMFEGSGLSGYLITSVDLQNIYYFSTQNNLDAAQSLGITFVGWNPAFNGEIEFDATAVPSAVVDGETTIVGTQNDKLISLFYTGGETKYVNIKDGVEFEFVDKNSIAKIKDGTLFFDDKSVNSAVPNSGYVDNIYFNTDLSAEEVTAILDKIPDDAYIELLGSPVYVIAWTPITTPEYTTSKIMIITKGDTQKYQIMYTSDSSNPSGFKSIFSKSKWEEDFSGYINYNDSPISSFESYTNLGSHNDILTDLVYIKPKQEPIHTIQYQGKNYVLSPFEDVKELPSSPNTETIYRVKEEPKPVPNDGSTIGTIYFNTEMSSDEVVGKINSYNITWVDGTAFSSPDLELYPICMFDGSSMSEFNNDPYVALIFAREKENHSAVIITFACFTTGRFVDVFLAELFGWKGITSQAINLNGITNFQGLSIGAHNDLINDLVSVTDFNQETKYYNYDGTKLNNINTKEEYVIEFEYDKNKYKDDEEFKKQVIEPYQLPIDILKKFPNEIDIIVRIKYTNNNIKGYTIYENYEVRDYDIIMTDGTAYVLKFICQNTSQVKRIELGVIFTENGTAYLNGFYTDNIGSSITVDTTISDSSTNPVQNKVIKEYVDNAIAGQSLTAGEGLKIENGVISLTYVNGDEEEF